MSFSFPPALLLLALVPAAIWLGYPHQRFRRRRDTVSLILRTAIIVLLALALAGMQIVRDTDRLAVVFLVDASDSVDPVLRDAALGQVRETIGAMGDADLAGLVVFAQRPLVERPVSDSRSLGPVRSSPDSGNTDIAAAVRLALAMFPSDAARRIVILSDGQQTIGDAEAAAQLAAAAGVEITYLPLQTLDAPDVRVTRFDAPAAVPQGQQFDLSLTVQADQATRARVDIFASGELITSETTDLREGVNNRTLTLVAQDSGFRDFTVIVQPESIDGYYQNNQLATFSQVIGPARVLAVGDAEETQYIAAALQEAELTVDVIAPENLPITAAGLIPYESVILANVAADRLTDRQMQTILAYVRDLGGGLVSLGGPEAYGPGGYFQTPLETVLPVSMQLEDQQRQPQLTIAYVIDRSGSMATLGPSGQPLIELAKAAIDRSIDFLQPTDRAGVATFDSAAYWIAEIQDVANREELRRLVGTLRPSGGTDIRAGLELVARDIVNEPTQLKHIIVLSDGLSNRAGLIEMVGALYAEAGVTLTSVALGDDSELMRDMAEAGGGTYRMAADPSTIPTIFAQETVLATRSYIFESPFVPAVSGRSPILQGIAGLPELRGYVGTSLKDAAQAVLRGPEPYADPILASWQFGLGRAVAFTSDATARWGTAWVTWDDFTRFWNQAVRWTMTEGGSDTIETRVTMEETAARVIVDARDDAGGFVNGLALSVSVVDPGLTARLIPLRQTAPGQYEATFVPAQEGAYLLAVNGGGSDGTTVTQTSGWVMSYSREYAAGRSESILPRIAAITGGGRLTDGLGSAFARTLTARGGAAPVFPFLLIAALLLLPIDIAVRRVLINRSDLARLAAALRARSRPAAEAATGRMAALMDARERARQAIESEDVTRSAVSTASALRTRVRSDETRRAESITTGAPPQPKPAPDPDRRPAPQPAAPKPAPAPTADDSGENIGARLLKRRRPPPT